MAIEENKISTGSLLSTLLCPVECDHCIWFCNSKIEKNKIMPLKTVKRSIEQFKLNNVKSIRISGGEPFYLEDNLKKILKIAENYYEKNDISIITSGFWGFSEEKAKKTLDSINYFGNLEISLDRFHLKRVPLKNIENILEISKQKELKVLLRVLIDSDSEFLIEPVKNIIRKYKVDLKVFGLDFKGRASNLDQSVYNNFDTFKKEIISSYKSEKNIENIKGNIKGNNDFLNSSMVLSPSVFPNGNIYACCDGLKLTYMGNINTENFRDMMGRWKKNLVSNFLLPDGSRCTVFSKFISPKCKSHCDFCKDFPLEDKGLWGEEAIQRRYIKIILTEDTDIKKLSESFELDREYLISISINRKDLYDKKIGDKILDFLYTIKKNKINFELSKPLPKCLFNNENYSKLLKDLDIPINCFECRELFSVENDKNNIKFCDGNYGPKLENFQNREDILSYFKNKRNSPVNICKKCIYYIRGSCDISCVLS